MGGFQERREFNNKDVPTDFLFLRSLIIQDTYDIVDKAWELRNLYRGKGGWLGPFKKF